MGHLAGARRTRWSTWCSGGGTCGAWWARGKAQVMGCTGGGD